MEENESYKNSICLYNYLYLFDNVEFPNGEESFFNIKPEIKYFRDLNDNKN